MNIFQKIKDKMAKKIINGSYLDGLVGVVSQRPVGAAEREKKKT
jgi:hypothetical protein